MSLLYQNLPTIAKIIIKAKYILAGLLGIFILDILLVSSGPLADSFGRINVGLIGAFGVIIFGLSSFANHYWEFVIIRSLIGFSIGLTLLPYSYIIEIIPTKFRGTMIVARFILN